ncbi:MAG TPA: DUF3048 domain-containing protein [Anaerolineales bacterium]
MLPRPCLLALCAVGFSLLTSCSAASGPDPVFIPAGNAAASPTPFQPGGDPSLLLTPAAPLATPAPGSSGQASGGSPQAPAPNAPSGGVAYSSTDVDPLTGLVPGDPSLLNRRPLAIKVSLYPRAIRPEYGLNEADVVFEYYIEWLNTRFIAIFYGNDAKQVGPVRSGRYFDEHITRMYHSYYVFNYADPREFTYFLGGDLQKFVVVPGYGDCPPFFQFRFSSIIKDVPHYETYFDTTRFTGCLEQKGADNQRQPLRSSFFSGSVAAGGSPVARIYTHYSVCDYNYWQYDAASGRYLRYQEASKIQTPAHLDDCVDAPETYAPLTDALNQQQVAADNVVELFVSHTFANLNEQQDEVYHINLVDGGKAFVFRDGYAYPARWQRTDIDQPLLLTTPAGAPIYLKPGRTFYQVIGETSTDWSDGPDWHFEFHTP